jgi:glucose/arabinose dehydrogenase
MRQPRLCVVALASMLALSNADAQNQRQVFGDLAVETIASGLDHPWGMQFLPGGRVLVTERPGRMRIVDKGKLGPPVGGVPKVFATGQGGLLDILLDADFASNRVLFFCFAEPTKGGGRTSMARAKLSADESRLEDVQIIFRQQGPPSRGNHWGCRIVQARDGNLFLALGDHFTHRDEAQNLRNHLGKIIRVKPNGSVPPDNPFVGRNDALPEIWSYGHRNAQGAALHPETGRYWTHEHGPRGGDEINIPQASKNYGWPVIGYGIDYSGARIHEATAKAGMEQPIYHWVPSIAPSGMAFNTGDLFPNWRGNLFVGALAAQALVRLELDGEKIVKEERLLRALGQRIRDVRTGPDGALWLLTDATNGRVLRVTPAK